MLCEGDPKAVEALFLPASVIHYADDVFLSFFLLFLTMQSWMSLCSIRTDFVSNNVLSKYISDANGNKGLKRLPKMVACIISC
jgi:hypothetical protein